MMENLAGIQGAGITGPSRPPSLIPPSLIMVLHASMFAHGREVSIGEQLATQVLLPILSGDLAPGQHLPSTRELGP